MCVHRLLSVEVKGQPFVFETKSHHVHQAGLKLIELHLPLPPECLDYSLCHYERIAFEIGPFTVRSGDRTQVICAASTFTTVPLGKFLPC